MCIRDRDETAEQRHESVAVALHQTEQVIGMVQLMREYLDAEQAEPGAFSTALEPVIRGLVEDLSSCLLYTSRCV